MIINYRYILLIYNVRWITAAGKASTSSISNTAKLKKSVMTVVNKVRRSQSGLDARRQSATISHHSYLSLSTNRLRRSSVANPMMPTIQVSSPETPSRRSTTTKPCPEDIMYQEPLYKSQSTACIPRKTSLTPSMRQSITKSLESSKSLDCNRSNLSICSSQSDLHTVVNEELSTVFTHILRLEKRQKEFNEEYEKDINALKRCLLKLHGEE